MDNLGYMPFVWLGIIILAVVIEAAVPALVSIWFLPGGLAALIASLCGGKIWLQVLLFAFFSAIALLVTRPLYKRYREKKRTVSTNADRAVGKVGLVTEEINALLSKGRVEVLGMSWAARTEDQSQIIPKGERVLVKRIEGVKLIVKAQKRGENSA